MGTNPHDQHAIASENARLASALRRVRRELERAVLSAERAAAAGSELRSQGVAGKRLAEELDRNAADLRTAAAEAGRFGGERDPEADTEARGVDGGTESEEKGRMVPPLGEVMDEMRRRRD